MSKSPEKQMKELHKYQKWQERRELRRISNERSRLDQISYERSSISGVDSPIRIAEIPYTKFEG
jgi:hypothetical protein